MVTTHNLGFPRIGFKRELKFALEAYWKGQSSLAMLEQVGTELRSRHWRDQAGLDFAPVGDFSFYDQVLDTSFMLGNLPTVCVTSMVTNSIIISGLPAVARQRLLKKSPDAAAVSPPVK